MHSTPPPDRKEWACDLLSLVLSAHKWEGVNSGLSCGPATQYTKIKESCLLPELIVLWHYQIQQRGASGGPARPGQAVKGAGSGNEVLDPILK